MQFVQGKMLAGAPDMSVGVVDVRDVAAAHMLAGFTPEAHGRYIVNADSVTFLDIGKILRRKFGPLYPFPRTTAPKTVVRAVAPLIGLTRDIVDLNVGYPLAFDNSRSRKELGLTYRTVEQTFTEQFQQMIDDALARKTPRSR